MTMIAAVKKMALLPSGLSVKERKQVTRAAFLMIGAVGLLVLLAFMLILAQGRQAAKFQADLERSFERRLAIRNTLESLQDMEIALLRHLFTGKAEFLRQSDKAKIALSSHLDAVQRAATGTPLESHAVRMSGLVAARMAELDQALTLHQQGHSVAAGHILGGGPDGTLNGEIRAIVAQMRAIEIRNSELLSTEVRKQTVASERVTLALLTGIAAAMVVASVATAADLRRRRQIEKDLKGAQLLARRAQEEAEHASSAKTDFLATMSHEIRTPLSGVIGYTELLRESSGLTTEQRDYIEHIQEAGSALLSVVNDVLDFTRIEAGQILLMAEPFSLAGLVDSTVAIVHTMAEKKRLPIIIHLDPNLPECLLGDTARLRQVLLNLLNNAVKFTDAGDVTLQVEHRGASSDGECVRFSVIDTGPGISQDQQGRLFQRFSQLDSPARRRFGGAGLGLAISKRFVELMGGEIGVESTEGRGSTFWFEVQLPRAEIGVSPPEETNTSVLPPRSWRILVVDDLDQNRDLAQAMLRSAGHHVDVVADGREAVEAVKAHPYDIVLMDVQMVGMDGVEATRLIRSLDHPAKNIPIIAMTADVLPQDVKVFRAAGMTDHLGKPYTRSQLLDKLHGCLNAGYYDPSGLLAGDAATIADVDDGIESLCRFMGREWVVQGLRELKTHLENTFQESDLESIDPKELARGAHSLVSRSSIFGFAEFSRLCIRLQEACKSGEDVPAAFEKARAASVEVLNTTAELLKHLQAGTEMTIEQ